MVAQFQTTALVNHIIAVIAAAMPTFFTTKMYGDIDYVSQTVYGTLVPALLVLPTDAIPVSSEAPNMEYVYYRFRIQYLDVLKEGADPTKSRVDRINLIAEALRAANLFPTLQLSDDYTVHDTSVDNVGYKPDRKSVV